MPTHTTDAFFNGKLIVRQDLEGYRFSIDAILLAFHARPRAHERVLDLGTGCGIIPLVLAYRQRDISAIGVEIQPELAQVAISNVRANHLQNQIAIVCHDMCELKPDEIGGPVDLVVCNPPFHKPNAGRLNPDRQRAIARHELKVNLDAVLRTTKRMLRTAGRFVTVYRADRLTDLFVQMRSQGIEPKSMRSIHGRSSAEAKLILVSGIKGAQPGTRIDPPLILYESNGEYTREVQQMLMP